MKRRVQIKGYIWRDKEGASWWSGLFFTAKSNWKNRFEEGYFSPVAEAESICEEGSLLYKAFNQDKKKFRVPMKVTFEGEGKESE